jgi:hypothetical protein
MPLLLVPIPTIIINHTHFPFSTDEFPNWQMEDVFQTFGGNNDGDEEWLPWGAICSQIPMF